MTFHLVRTFAAATICLIVSGCMLSNPYVRTPTVDQSVGSTCGDQCSIGAAQHYSRDVREAYRQRLGYLATLKNNTGAAEILLGAAAMGLAASHAHRDALVGVGLAGATTFGLATWFGNSDLEALYTSAIKALTCAESAVEPLRLSDTEIREIDEGMLQIRTQSPAFAATLARLDGLMDTLKNYSSGAREGLLLARAQTTSSSAHTSLSHALGSYENAAALRRLNAIAGNELARTVERITASVDEETRKAQPDLQAAFTIAGGLGAIADKIAPGTDALLQEAMKKSFTTDKQQQGHRTVSAPRKAVPQGLDDAVEQAIADVETAAGKIASAVAELDAITSHVQTADANAALGACNISVSAAMALTPSSLTLPHGARSATFVAAGGKPPYVGRVIGVAPTGLAVVNPSPGDHAFQLTTTADTPAGSYVVSVYDSTTKSIALAVEVGADSTPAPAAKQDNPAPATTATLNATLDDLHGKLDNQSFVGFKITKVERTDKVFIITTDPAASDAADKSKIRQAILDVTLEDKTTVNDRLTALQATLKIAP